MSLRKPNCQLKKNKKSVAESAVSHLRGLSKTVVSVSEECENDKE